MIKLLEKNNGFTFSKHGWYQFYAKRIWTSNHGFSNSISFYGEHNTGFGRVQRMTKRIEQALKEIERWDEFEVEGSF